MKLGDILKKTPGVRKNLTKHVFFSVLKNEICFLLKKQQEDVSITLTEKELLIQGVTPIEKIYLEKNKETIYRLFKEYSIPRVPFKYR